jgi:hypothetical protein
MRRTTTALVAAALPLTLLAFAPGPTGEASDSDSQLVVAGEPGTTVTPGPIDVTYHLHGDDAAALVDENAYADGGILTMDRTAPEGDFESQQLKNYAQGPNARCAGNGLWPVWTGFMGKGTAVGEGTLAFDVVASTPGPVTVDVFTDVTGQACNEAYPEPVASTTVTLPAGSGRVEAVLDLDGVAPGAYLMVQLRPADSPNAQPNPVPNPGAPIWPGAVLPMDPLAQARILYDGADYDATLTFTCQPDDITFDADGEPSHAPTCLPY